MTNAKKELEQELVVLNKTLDDIVAISIGRVGGWMEDLEYVLRTNHVVTLDALDFIYDSGYGRQELAGIVLFNDNTWLERREYDGSEWWEYNKPPTVEMILGV